MPTVLFVASSPADQVRLQVAREGREVRDAVRLQAPGALTIHVETDVRLSELAPLLQQYKPEILHFAGHGDHEKICLMDDQNGTVDLKPEVLLAILRAVGGVQCVVLNSCEGTAFAELLLEATPITVTLRGEASDNLARDFAAMFYGTVARGDTVRNAFDMARVHIAAGHGVALDLPVLRERPDGTADVVRLAAARSEIRAYFLPRSGSPRAYNSEEELLSARELRDSDEDVYFWVTLYLYAPPSDTSAVAYVLDETFEESPDGRFRLVSGPGSFEEKVFTEGGFNVRAAAWNPSGGGVVLSRDLVEALGAHYEAHPVEESVKIAVARAMELLRSGA